MKRLNFVACLRPSQNVKLGIFTDTRAVDGKGMYKKSVMHVQSCWSALSSYCYCRRILTFLLFTIHCDSSKTEFSRGKSNCSC